MPVKQHPKRFSTLRTDWLPAGLDGLHMLANAVTFFFLAVYFKENLGFSGAMIGLLFALRAVTGVAITLPAGMANDRVSSRLLVILALAIQAGCLVGMALIVSWWPFVGVYVLWGLATGLYRLSLDVQVLKTDEGDRTGKRIGVYQGCRFAGMTVGVVLSGWLISRFDFDGCLLLVAAACLLLIVPALWLTPTPVSRFDWSAYRADLRRPEVLFFAVGLFLFATHWGAEATSYGLFLYQDLHLGLDSMGWYMAAESLAVMLTVLGWGHRLKSPAQLLPTAAWGLLLSGLGQLGMVTGSLALSVSARAVHGVGDGLMFLVIFFGIARFFAQERRGGNTGFITMATMLGMVMGSLFYGPLGEAHGYAMPLWLSGASVLGLMAVLLPLLRRQPTTSS